MGVQVVQTSDLSNVCPLKCVFGAAPFEAVSACVAGTINFCSGGKLNLSTKLIVFTRVAVVDWLIWSCKGGIVLRQITKPEPVAHFQKEREKMERTGSVPTL